MNTIKYIFLLFFLHLNIYALDSIENLNSNIIIHKSGYFKTSENLTAQEAYTHAISNELTHLPKDAKSFGLTNETYWFLFEVSSIGYEQLYFDSKSIIRENIQELYVFNKNQLININKSGSIVDVKDRIEKVYPIRFKLEKNSNNFIYLLKIKSKFPVISSFAFSSEAQLNSSWITFYKIVIVTSSIAFAFIIYNLFLYFITKDKSILSYTIFMFGYFITNITLFRYVTNDLNIPSILVNDSFIIGIPLCIIGLAFFTIYFLELKGKIKKIVLIVGIINFLFVLLRFFVSNSLIQKIAILFLAFSLIFFIVITIKSYKEGAKQALYYIIATGGTLFFVIAFMGVLYWNLLPYNSYTINITNFSMVWDTVMLSFAIAYKIKFFQNENEKNQKLALIKSKQSSLGELSGNLAHQWRTPLAELGSINTNIEAKLKFSKISKEELLQKIDINKNILNHLSQTINTFQSFFQNSNIETKFSVDDEVKRCIDFVNDSMKNNLIDVNFSSDDNYFLQGNANEFSQIILNIVLNSKDALCETNIENKYINIKLKKFDDKFKIEIEDNAGGIKIEPIESIFESYITSKDKGIGIGLFIVKTIVEQKFNGKISASNTQNGARFEIFFN
ncbi:MAG: sensor histidine kinase [Aliarcobacter sp.]|nr:sensor histidine kinase [Aliarcobacter sp.]